MYVIKPIYQSRIHVKEQQSFLASTKLIIPDRFCISTTFAPVYLRVFTPLFSHNEQSQTKYSFGLIDDVILL